MTTPLPQHNPRLFGHELAVRQIVAAFEAGRMHHALLLTGMDGIGKTTLAFHVANYVMSGGVIPIGNIDLDHPVARLIAAESHPDLFVLRRAQDDKTGEPKESIAVEDARQVAPFLRKTATHGNWRVVIIDEAHLLNRFGQNAILKIVEEPPRNSLIILTTTTAGVLLPTIRSRCNVQNLQPLSAAVMQQALAHLNVAIDNHAEPERLMALAGGSLGFLLKLLHSDALELFDALQSLLHAPGGLDYTRLHQLADRVGRKADGEAYQTLTQLMLNLISHTIRDQARGQQPQLARSLQLWDKIKELFSQAEHARLDRKLTLIQAVVQMREAV